MGLPVTPGRPAARSLIGGLPRALRGCVAAEGDEEGESRLTGVAAPAHGGESYANILAGAQCSAMRLLTSPDSGAPAGRCGPRCSLAHLPDAGPPRSLLVLLGGGAGSDRSPGSPTACVLLLGCVRQELWQLVADLLEVLPGRQVSYFWAMEMKPCLNCPEWLLNLQKRVLLLGRKSLVERRSCSFLSRISRGPDKVIRASENYDHGAHGKSVCANWPDKLHTLFLKQLGCINFYS